MLYKEIFSVFIKDNYIQSIMYILFVIIVLFLYTIIIPKSVINIANNNQVKESFGINIISNIKNKTVMGWFYIILFLFILYGVIEYKKNITKLTYVNNISNYARKSYIEYIFRTLSINYKEIPESILSYISGKTYIITSFFVSFFIEQLIPYIIISLYLFGLLCIFDKRLAFLFIGIHVLFGIINFFQINSYLMKEKKLEKYKEKYIISYLGDIIKNISNVIYDNDLPNILNKFKKIFFDYSELKIKVKCFYINNSLIFSLIYSIFLVITIFCIMTNKKNKDLKLLIIFVILIHYSMLEMLLNEYTNNFFHKFLILNNLNNKLSKINDDIYCDPIKGIYSLYFENVSFKYNGSNNYIIKDLTLKIEPKKMNVIMGKSGSGKTTIMKLIVKMLKPTSGKIYANDVDMSTLCDNDIRNNIYYVNQRTILFNDTVLKNFKYGNNSTNKKIINLLEKYDLLSYFDTLDKGIKTISGHNGSNLSLGMQKIIMIVRGILKPNKNIVIFDEPLTSLDKESREKIIHLIVNETKGKTLIIITHDTEILPYADKVIKLKAIN